MVSSDLLKLVAAVAGLVLSISYGAAAVILISGGVRDAKSGSCCLPNYCNPYSLSTDSVASWKSGGICLYSPQEAEIMNCNGSSPLPWNCSLTNEIICKSATGYGVTLATGIVGIVTAVLGGMMSLTLLGSQSRSFYVVTSATVSCVVTQIVLGGIVFHWQLTDQKFTFCACAEM